MYKYRLAEPRDLEDLVRMSKDFYAAHRDSVEIPFDEDSVSLTMMGMMNLDYGQIVIVYESESEESLPPVEEQGPPLGAIAFVKAQSDINMHVKIAHEKMFWLDEEHRGGLVARTMVIVAQVGLKTDGVQYAYLSKLSNSPETVDPLYASMGYREVESHFLKEL